MYSAIHRWFMTALLGTLIFCTAEAQHSVAREWNEALLQAIRNDFARPPVHARNLFHISAAMYDSWAVFSDDAEPYLIGKQVNGYSVAFNGFTPISGTIDENRRRAISYASYRLILHRFERSPRFNLTLQMLDELMLDELGYDPTFTSTDYSSGSAAALGNYIAAQYIAYGIQDGANELDGYRYNYYEPVNEPLAVSAVGNPTITDPNRWQPLAFEEFIDQAGNVIPGGIPGFLGPEWGQVLPFALKQQDKTTYTRGGYEYQVYHDPGHPPYIDPVNGGAASDEYKWGFSLVAVWSGHLDATQDALIDISPASFGNVSTSFFPTTFSNYDQFYDYLGGGDLGQGRTMNPKTGQPYEPQVVALGDYARILAEFWADGPDSETPPGHWFDILNHVNDMPTLVKKWNGQGDILDDLEWDIKAYFALGGAMHDVAISAWGIKGYYDYVRPISAIRYMADQGQSSDPQLPNYHVAGMPLVEGHIELVLEGDPLVGDQNENLHKIKLWAWKGPTFIENPETDVAGVGWILAENWWPYQRPTFVTPPFSGFVSGHSTYSRAAAEIMTLVTGDPFFPGGMGEFEAPMNEFLVFEKGPTQDIVLQWATYRDASDQCSLSRIWGGIHPPQDDIMGRIIGERIGQDAFAHSANLFKAKVLGTKKEKVVGLVYPNPMQDELNIQLPNARNGYVVTIFTLSGQRMYQGIHTDDKVMLDVAHLQPGKYVLTIKGEQWESNHFIVKK